MQESKLMFSDAELQLAMNVSVILTKNRIIQKVYDQYGVIATQLFQDFAPLRQKYPLALPALPKISKGENYEGLPWVMLDYPRCFDKEMGNLAFRIFFRWGYYYFVQFQVSKLFLPNILHLISSGKLPAFIEGHPVFAGYPANPWSFEIPQEGLFAYNPDTFSVESSADQIFKLGVKIPIEACADLGAVCKSLSQLLVENWEMP